MSTCPEKPNLIPETAFPRRRVDEELPGFNGEEKAWDVTSSSIIHLTL